MDPAQRLRSYAELTVKVGANVAPGQVVHVEAYVEQVEAARAIAAAAYEAGAKYVDLWYWDQHGKRERIKNAPADTLDWVPPWLDARNDALVEMKGCSIRLAGNPEPDVFAGLDPVRAGKDRMPFLPTRLPLIESAQVNWTIVPYPTAAWAERVYGEPDVERLWGDLVRFLRLDQPDPTAAWKEHLARLTERARLLNQHNFDALRYEGPGTDLKIGLLPKSRWHAAGFGTKWGRSHVPNLPTEEVFTSPDKRRAEGKIRSTKPLVLHGSLIEGLEVEMKDGRIVRVDATSNADVVRGELEADETAAALGEVALVDKASPIGQSGNVYYDTLLDENATSHIAYGGGFTGAYEGGMEMSVEELSEAGINFSKVHTDFMVGGPEVSIYGLDESGTETPIIVENEWRLS